MAEKSQVTPTGWSHYDDATTFSRVSPTGWDQFQAVGGATYTITADSGSFVLSGQNVSLLAARAMVAATASFVLTGQDVGLLAARKLTAESGAFVLTGQDVTLTYTPSATYSMTADAGSFTLTGGASGLLASRLLTAESAAYLLTGSNVTLTYSSQSEEEPSITGTVSWGKTKKKRPKVIRFSDFAVREDLVQEVRKSIPIPRPEVVQSIEDDEDFIIINLLGLLDD